MQTLVARISAALDALQRSGVFPRDDMAAFALARMHLSRFEEQALAFAARVADARAPSLELLGDWPAIPETGTLFIAARGLASWLDALNATAGFFGDGPRQSAGRAVTNGEPPLPSWKSHTYGDPVTLPRASSSASASSRSSLSASSRSSLSSSSSVSSLSSASSYSSGSSNSRGRGAGGPPSMTAGPVKFPLNEAVASDSVPLRKGTALSYVMAPAIDVEAYFINHDNTALGPGLAEGFCLMVSTRMTEDDAINGGFPIANTDKCTFDGPTPNPPRTGLNEDTYTYRVEIKGLGGGADPSVEIHLSKTPPAKGTPAVITFKCIYDPKKLLWRTKGHFRLVTFQVDADARKDPRQTPLTKHEPDNLVWAVVIVTGHEPIKISAPIALPPSEWWLGAMRFCQLNLVVLDTLAIFTSEQDLDTDDMVPSFGTQRLRVTWSATDCQQALDNLNAVYAPACIEFTFPGGAPAAAHFSKNGNVPHPGGVFWFRGTAPAAGEILCEYFNSGWPPKKRDEGATSVIDARARDAYVRVTKGDKARTIADALNKRLTENGITSKVVVMGRSGAPPVYCIVPNIGTRNWLLATGIETAFSLSDNKVPDLDRMAAGDLECGWYMPLWAEEKDETGFAWALLELFYGTLRSDGRRDPKVIDGFVIPGPPAFQKGTAAGVAASRGVQKSKFEPRGIPGGNQFLADANQAHPRNHHWVVEHETCHILLDDASENHVTDMFCLMQEQAARPPDMMRKDNTVRSDRRIQMFQVRRMRSYGPGNLNVGADRNDNPLLSRKKGK